MAIKPIKNKLTEFLTQNKFQSSIGENTNNGWGFGGYIGDCYRNEKWMVRIGKACYRHAGTEKFVTLTNIETRERLIDLSQSNKAFDKIINLIAPTL